VSSALAGVTKPAVKINEILTARAVLKVRMSNYHIKLHLGNESHYGCLRHALIANKSRVIPPESGLGDPAPDPYKP
jgi:hypothetical protein